MTIALTDDRWQLFASHAVIAGSAEVDRYKRIINADTQYIYIANAEGQREMDRLMILHTKGA